MHYHQWKYTLLLAAMCLLFAVRISTRDMPMGFVATDLCVALACPLLHRCGAVQHRARLRQQTAAVVIEQQPLADAIEQAQVEQAFQLADGRADFLYGRIISGPHPALTDFEYEQRDDGTWQITAGTPTWAGQDVAACQSLLNRLGISSFLSECQQDVEPPAGGMFDHIAYVRCERHEVPPLIE